MKSSAILLLLIEIFLVQHVAVLAVSENFDFFYFVQQWPGSVRHSDLSCTSPKPGKVKEDFGIRGLWPTYLDGTYPTYCDSDNPFNPTSISDVEKKLQKHWPAISCPDKDGLTFWGHEWDKYGTCSESVLDQEEYFEKALKLKKKIKLLHILHKEGVKPDGGYYSLYQIKKAIEDEIEVTPWISCNEQEDGDESGNSQLYQVYVCVDKAAKKFIHCPVLPRKSCSSKIQFPRFGNIDTNGAGGDDHLLDV